MQVYTPVETDVDPLLPDRFMILLDRVNRSELLSLSTKDLARSILHWFFSFTREYVRTLFLLFFFVV